jgi:hypothetical protein
MARIFFVISAFVLLAGCASPGEREAAACHSYGFTPGTDAFANCMQQADMQRRQMLGNYLMMRAAQPAPQVQYVPMPVPPPPVRMQTTCTTIGNSTYCN